MTEVTEDNVKMKKGSQLWRLAVRFWTCNTLMVLMYCYHHVIISIEYEINIKFIICKNGMEKVFGELLQKPIFFAKINDYSC